MTTIFEREHKTVELKYYEYGEEYELTVGGQMGSEITLYFDKNGKYINCIGCTNS
jgi:hypothetical protein